MAGTRQEAETVDPLSIAYYCTGHGLGHATRSIEVCKHLVERGHTVTVITGAPARVFLQEVCGVQLLSCQAQAEASSSKAMPVSGEDRCSKQPVSTARRTSPGGSRAPPQRAGHAAPGAQRRDQHVPLVPTEVGARSSRARAPHLADGGSRSR